MLFGKNVKARQSLLLALAVSGLVTRDAQAGVLFGYSGSGIAGGARWDAAPRSTTISGTVYERSLSGGLRFSMQGTSYQAYRDLFSWDAVPSVAAFTTAVNQAFNAWAAVDPTSKLGSTLTFVNDPTTAAVGTGVGGLDARGAEIDLLASTDAGSWNPGSTGTQGETFFNFSGSTVTLTSGVAGYAAGAINGADITLNNNPGAVYNLDLFRRLLSHEIGHSLGFGDAEGTINPGAFIDDNFDGSDPAGTLNNNWASLVNPLNPAGTPGLSRYSIGSATTASGVNLLMESNGLGISAANPVTNLVPLTNDEYNIRQFTYPVIPEPAGLSLAAMALAALGRRRWRRR